ncbi:hypothetical protein Acsp06_35420 [Actinomycetospora sp. NBRC 106375]|uniref:hypothetical protein n=1 Tax=Actinomycetospora sp. NBRC 106375 TaxID=3032207 RepID=UPI0024A201F5|nr:hypothetical protein [Actinomycetospora sp. NBRC 106375]GLZ47357.1 hypothetical protein Acsp06_35420 [Actinomycetospora sp. NBRC 106375]
MARAEPGEDEQDDEQDDEPRLRWPTAAIVLAVVLVVALVTAWFAGSSSTGPGDGGIPGSTDAARLGPAPGETVAGYLARARVVPPAPPGPRPALVELTAELDVGGAAALAGVPGVRPRAAVFRVPLPRVQTALRQITLDGSVDPATGLRLAEAQAANRAGEQARTSTGRAAAVATTESARLSAGCACVVALVVEIDPVTVPTLLSRPDVRAVEVAPADARMGSLAVSPLLPEQVDDGRDPPETVGPVPDDGPVPPP